jgi:hypothetical protein
MADTVTVVTQYDDDGDIVDYTLTFKQGKTCVFYATVYEEKPVDGVFSGDLVDLSGYEFRGMGRAGYGTLKQKPKLFDIYAEESDTAGVVRCEIYPADSAACDVQKGVYEVEAYDPADPTKVFDVIAGKFYMNYEASVE